MAYDPFAPGPFTVGTRTGIAIDKARDGRPLPFEVWHPEAAGPTRRPLVLYCHASFGQRRQSAYLSTHLASHGHVVVAADHTGNAAADFAERAQRRAAGEAPTPEEADAYLRKIVADRVPDLRFLLDHVLAGGVDSVSDAIDGQRIGLVGWSFGGWAVLATPEVDERVRTRAHIHARPEPRASGRGHEAARGRAAIHGRRPGCGAARTRRERGRLRQ